MTGLEAAQRAVFGALDSAGVAVYAGEAPQGAPGPYVVMGDPTETPLGALGARLTSNTLTLHIWSPTGGSTAQAFALLSAVDAALGGGHNVGARRLYIHREFATVLHEEGWVHVPARYRITTTEAA